MEHRITQGLLLDCLKTKNITATTIVRGLPRMHKCGLITLDFRNDIKLTNLGRAIAASMEGIGLQNVHDEINNEIDNFSDTANKKVFLNELIDKVEVPFKKMLLSQHEIDGHFLGKLQRIHGQQM